MAKWGLKEYCVARLVEGRVVDIFERKFPFLDQEPEENLKTA